MGRMFGGIPMADLRANRAAVDLDLSTYGLRATEARVLAALLPHAPSCASINLDGQVLPIRFPDPGKPEGIRTFRKPVMTLKDVSYKYPDTDKTILSKACATFESVLHALLSRAFATLPESEQQPLWEQKVRFMCKGGGKGLAGQMYALKDFEPEVQAHVWSVMGSSAEGKGEQLAANLRAAESLSEFPLKKVDYLVKLAEWLYCNDFPLRDAEDQLKGAIDVLMDNEVDTAAQDEDEEDDGASVVSGTRTRRTTADRKSVV